MKSFRNWVKNIFFLLVYLFSGGTLVLVIDGVSTGTDLTPFNNIVEQAVSHIRTPFLTQFLLFITNIGSPFVLTCLALALAIYLLLHKDTYDALLYITAILLAVFASTILKNTFQITRPLNGLVSLNSWGFPSGHAAVATAFFFSTAYTFWAKVKLWPNKVLLVVSCVVGAILVSFSRIYLGAHFALDVLAGTALGLCSVSMIVLIFNIFLEEESWRLKRRSARL